MLAAVLVVVLACWVAMQFIVAAGLWCSIRSVSSWRSLLATLAIGYGGGLALAFLLLTISAGLGCVCLFLFTFRSNGPTVPTLVEVVLPYLALAGFVAFHAFVLWNVAVSMLESAIRHSIEHDRPDSGSHYVRQHGERSPRG